MLTNSKLQHEPGILVLSFLELELGSRNLTPIEVYLAYFNSRSQMFRNFIVV